MEEFLKDYIIDDSNIFAYTVVKAMIEDTKNDYSPVFIYGDTGVGKSYLVKKVADKMKEKEKVLLISCEEFLNDLVKSSKKEEDYLKKYYQYDLIIIEDIQNIKGKGATQDEVNRLIKYTRDSGKKMIMTSNIFPQDTFDKTGYLNLGLVCNIDNPTDKLKKKIINDFEEKENIKLNKEKVEEFIKESKDIRILEGKLKKEKFKNSNI